MINAKGKPQLRDRLVRKNRFKARGRPLKRTPSSFCKEKSPHLLPGAPTSRNAQRDLYEKQYHTSDRYTPQEVPERLRDAQWLFHRHTSVATIVVTTS